jgi:coproporphyrinogen III oxidase-like Fe-S oxidoreductase
VRKCPYCDFNSHEGRGELPFDAYVDALIVDLDQDLPLVWGRTISSVFFGGGTPSLFPPEAIDRFLQAASARLRFAPSLEITLETNPGTAEHGRFEHYLAAGVNRLSFGVQSFNAVACNDSAASTTARRPSTRSSSRRTPATRTSTST